MALSAFQVVESTVIQKALIVLT